MKILKRITSVLSVITGIYFLLALLLRVFIMIYAKKTSASAIGIIGGADGPTAIFVGAAHFKFLSALPVIIFFISAAVNIFLRIKIRKNGGTS